MMEFTKRYHLMERLFNSGLIQSQYKILMSIITCRYVRLKMGIVTDHPDCLNVVVKIWKPFLTFLLTVLIQNSS